MGIIKEKNSSKRLHFSSASDLRSFSWSTCTANLGAVMCTRGGTTGSMKEILQKTLVVSRELDALQREHQTFITDVATSEPEHYVVGK